MKQIPLSQGLFARVDDEDYLKLSKGKWWISKCGGRVYAYGSIDGLRKISMHRYLLEETDRRVDVDHWDGDTLNNQRCNLRRATRTLNNANSKPNKHNTSGFKGVRFDSQRGLWSARIMTKFLGRFDIIEDAARAYNDEARKLWGDFAWLNDVSPLFPTIERSLINRNNTSGFKGVYFNKLNTVKVWTAEIIRAGRKTRLGSFERIEDAALAYELAAKQAASF